MPKLYREDVKENYCSALLLSAKNGNTSAVSWSLGQGADVQIRDHTEPELTYGDYGPNQSASRRWFRTDMTALHWAAYHCHVDVLGLLLHAGANIHSRAKPFEFITGRRCQIYFRVMSIFEMHLLADRSFRTDVLDSSIRTGANAMYFALMEEYNETLDSEKEDYDEGRLAQRHGSRIDTVKGLTEAGVSLITHIGLGLHALHQACGNWDCDMASFLLQLEGRQDNAMVRDRLGNTPLHYLAMCAPENDMQPEPVIQLLLRHGADINAVNSAGLTPLQLCFRIPPLSFEKTRRVHLAPAIALAEAGACLFPDIAMRLEQGPRLRWGARRYNESGSISAVTERQDACDRTLPAISDRDMDMAEARSVHLGVYRLLQELRGEEVESEERRENIAAWTTDDWRSHWQSQFGFGRQTMF